MKIKEFFKKAEKAVNPEGYEGSNYIRDPEETAKIGTSEKASEEVDEQELKYEDAIVETSREYNDEIRRIESEFQEKIKNMTIEEAEKMREEKDKRQTALEEGRIKAIKNLEEALENYRRGKHERD